MTTNNWPDDLVISGNHSVWPVEASEACRETSPDGGHYCTLVRGHRGDHLTLTARWTAS